MVGEVSLPFSKAGRSAELCLRLFPFADGKCVCILKDVVLHDETNGLISPPSTSLELAVEASRPSQGSSLGDIWSQAVNDLPFPFGIVTVLNGGVDIVLESANAACLCNWRLQGVPVKSLPATCREMGFPRPIVDYWIEKYCQAEASGKSMTFSRDESTPNFHKEVWKSATITCLSRTPDGLRCSFFIDNPSEPSRMVMALIRQEQELSTQKKHLTSLINESKIIIETIPQMVFTAKSNGSVDYVNKRWLSFTGQSSDQAIDMGWLQVVHPDEAGNVACAWKAACQAGEPFETQYRLKGTDGLYRWYLTRAEPLHDRNGRIVKFFGTCTDWDEKRRFEEERRAAAEALAKSEARFRRLFESNIIGAKFANMEGKISNANDAFLNMVGYSREEMLDGKLTWKDLTPPEWHEVSQAHYQMLADTGFCAPFEKQYLRKDGSRIHILLGLAMMEDSSSDFVAFVVDITQRKLAEEKAMQMSQTKSYFIANVSHELRTPLNGITSVVELLLDLPMSPQQREYVDILKTSSSSLLSLINELLDFGRMEAGKLKLDETSFELQTVVEEVIELLGEQANRKAVDLVYSCANDLPPMLIGDPGRLRQIIINLAGNAIKFTQSGHVLIKVMRGTNDPARPDTCTIRVEVHDTGIGIKPDQLRNLFLPFSQVDGTSSRRYHGSGLGLAICKQLTTLLGGDIGIDSSFGVGSVFWFTVRFKLDDGNSLQPSLSTSSFCSCTSSSSVSSEHLAFLVPKRVLLVDQTEVVRQSVADTLQQRGVEVVSAASASEAASLVLLAGPFNVVLLSADRAPEPLFEALDQQQEAANVYAAVILVGTGHSQPTTEMPRVGGRLSKPVLHSRLVDVVARAPTSNRKRTHGDGLSSSSEELPSAKLQNKGCILVVEDNQVNQKVTVRQLEKLGYRAVVAGNGIEALRTLEESPMVFALILMDCQMPEMDGFEATREIRRRERATNKHIPIIALTANAMSDAADQCREAEMDGYISKPVKISDIKNVLDQWLDVTSPAYRASAFGRRSSFTGT
eukprot:TRINITY_DN7972_c0_g2_i2.p1 TRINITY_DN7972_c0_g2~~TRINITY_DN7972_c0_g2_i2.p1  ORF type:complete len:1122 (+),score=253.32 TRINITY_DN7972_c0_g2_i2:281-3367(+)